MATTTTPPGALYDVAQEFLDGLLAGNTAASDQMVAAWGSSRKAIRSDMDQLYARIDALKAAGLPVGPSLLYEKARLTELLRTVDREVAQFAATASDAIKHQQWHAVGAALKHAEKLAKVAAAESLQGVATSFLQTNPENLKHLVGFLADGSPLDDLLNGMGPEMSSRIRTTLITGLARGKNPQWMARRIEKTLDMPRWRAVRLMRTETLRAYRAATRASFAANADVVPHWVWTAKLDARTCASCIVMHGTVHDAHEVLDGHPHCRCAMVPRTASWEELGIKGVKDTRPPLPDGKAWLRAQSGDVQRAILGAARWRMWRRGEIDLDDLVARPFDPAWGTMRRERTLSEIKGGLNANFGGAAGPTGAKAVAQADPARAALYADRWTAEQLEAIAPDFVGAVAEDLRFAAVIHRESAKLNRILDRAPADPAKVKAAVAKMNAAVESKGFPSKGYSQTVAIYKAQANGKIGTKVGVVKSLDWGTKHTAQKALQGHGEWLAKWTAKKQADEAAEALATAEIQALDGAWKQFLDAGGTDHSQKALLKGNLTTDKAKAHFAALDGQLNDAQAALDDAWKQAPIWEPPTVKNVELHLGADGSVNLVLKSGTSVPYSPIKAANGLASNYWQPKVITDPAKVAGYLHDLKKGTVTAEQLADHSPHWPPADAINAKEALAQWNAVLNEPIDAAKVKTILGVLKGKHLTPEEVLADFAGKPGMNSAKAAVAQHAQYLDDLKKVQLSDIPLDEAKVAKYLHMLETGEFAPQELIDDFAQFNSPYLAEVKAAVGKFQAAKPKPKPPFPGAKPPFPGGAGPGPGLPFKVDELKAQPGTLGTHGAKVYVDPATGQKWLFKPQDGFLSELDEAAASLQRMVGLKSPEVHKVTIGGKSGSIQRMFDARPAFPGGFKPEALSPADLAAVQREHVIDWLLGNHDGHQDQFLKLPDGSLVGIDKGQAFRWFGQDKLDWEFHPNASYGAPEPVYNALWRTFAKGGNTVLDDPLKGELGAFIRTIQAIDEAELRALFRPYAEQAAAARKLGLLDRAHSGASKVDFAANDVEEFLAALVKRQASLADDFADLYKRAAAARSQALPGWAPAGSRPSVAALTKAQQKWVGKDAPKPPVQPAMVKSRAELGKEVLGTGEGSWLSKVEARYAANPYKAKPSLQQSNNWSKVTQVIEQQDIAALDHLLASKYVDQELYDEAKRLIAQVNDVYAKSADEIAKATTAYKRAVTKYKRELGDWKIANGVVEKAGELGLDGARRTTHQWALKTFPKAEKFTPDQQAAIRTYTGNAGYVRMNGHLRSSGGSSTTPEIRDADAAFDATAGLEEDVILLRGTTAEQFNLPQGTPITADSMVGQTFVEHGYFSTSVGDKPAFAGKPIWMVIRAPSGTKALYVDNGWTSHGGERELLLPRGTKFVVHSVYRAKGRTYVEAEVVPTDWVKPTTWAPVASTTARKEINW